MNQLAQSVSPQQGEETKESSTTGRNEQCLYIPPRSLPPITSFPCESLSSVLSRLARNMHHPYPEQLLFRSPFTPSTLLEDTQDEPRLPGEASNATLASLLQLPREHLPHFTDSGLIASLGLPPYSLLRRQTQLTEPRMRSWFHFYERHHRARVCPSCIRERNSYDRVWWSLRGVLCCPLHKVRLLERCPSCLQDIPTLRSHTERCPFCMSETYTLPAERLPKNSVLMAGTSLLLTKFGLPISEASTAWWLLGSSPLLAEDPSIYFALLLEFTEEIGSYYAYSRQELLRFCALLGESTLSSEQLDVDPYAVDADVLLFHTLFSLWPKRFFTLLTLLYRTAQFEAFEEHERQYKG